jgi:hypothetical protein
MHLLLLLLRFVVTLLQFVILQHCIVSSGIDRLLYLVSFASVGR